MKLKLNIIIATESYDQWNPQSGIPPILTEETQYSEDTFYPPTGTDLSFFCGALGQPEPSVIWLKNMARIGNRSNFWFIISPLDGNH